MISQIVIPDLGATGGDVTFMEWLVEPGDRVKAGQPLFTVETDKAAVEVQSYRDGFVRELLVEVGDAVPIGSPVALVADSMEEPLKLGQEEGKPSPAEGYQRPVSGPTPEKKAEQILASPIARRMAEAEGLDLSTIKGSGPQGQISKRDVERAISSAKVMPELETDLRREPITAMRRAIATRTFQSKQQIPHFYADITVDMSAALILHKEAGEWAKRKGWISPTLTDICLRALALTMAENPRLNARLLEDEILYFQVVDIGLVVGLADGGMLVPVVHHADRHNLHALAAITHRLREQAQQGIVTEASLSGGAISISNLGMYGLDSFAAIINPPQIGMLALGAVREMPAVHQGAVVPRPLMKAKFSVDHRIVDGIDAARFLVAWKELLEAAERLMPELPEEIG